MTGSKTNGQMDIRQFKKWLEEKRRRLAYVANYYEETPIFVRCVAGDIAIEASTYAAEVRLHELMRDWNEPDVLQVDKYLVECLGALPEPKIKQVYNLEEAAQRLGVSRRTVSRLIEAGDLKCTPIRGRKTITEAQLQAYLASEESLFD
jgi:excisionase family DNA binding protein